MLPAYRTILCCHALGPRDAEVLAHAYGLARTGAARVVVLHAIEPTGPQAQHLLGTLLSTHELQEMREDAHLLATNEITDQAREIAADLIVMGAHRHTTVGELLLGSTAHRVSQLSPVPVLLVRLEE